MTTPAIDRARAFSEHRLAALRAIVPGVVPTDVVVVACGSYARREASAASDFDYFAIAPLPDEAPGWVAALREGITTIVTVAPADDGAFGKIETPDTMVRNIGGQGDSNQKLTRRMLFLLEGAPINADRRFCAVRRSILDRYLGTGSANEPLAMFLLNDIIRYYRTMVVDYEYKTTEGERPKPWALRNAKLMFSRKLLYASGLFSVAATLEGSAGIKAERIGHLLDLPVMDRMAALCGAERAGPLFESYDRFLAFLEDADTRRHLDGLMPGDHDDALFTAIKAEGGRFSAALLRLFHETFEPHHPIHQAMVL